MPSLLPYKRVLVAVMAVAAAALPSAAGAIVPSARATLARATEASPAPASVQVTWVERAVEGPSTLALRVVFDGAARLRLDRQSLQDGLTQTTVWDAAVKRGAGGGLPPGSEVLPLTEAPAWLLWLVGHPVADIASVAGVDTKVTSLAHRGPVIVVVVGAQALEFDRSQLHFDRETARLLAAIDVRADGVSVHMELHPEPPAAPSGDAAKSGDADPQKDSPPEDGPAKTAESSPEVWPSRLVLVEDGKRRELVRTWLRVGEAVEASALEPPEPAAP